MAARRLGAIETSVVRTKYGPAQILVDTSTGSILTIPLPGNSSRFVREDVISVEEQKRVCIPGSIRRINVPSVEYGEETGILMCCLKRGRATGRPPNIVYRPRAAFVPIVFHHPRDEAPTLVSDFESGRLQYRRRGVRARIRRFGR